MRAGARMWITSIAMTIATLGPATGPGWAAEPDDGSPALPAAELGQPGWTGGDCGPMSGFENCFYTRDDGAVLGLAVWPLRPFDDVQVMVDALAQSSCIGGTPIDVAPRPTTAGCIVNDAAIGTQFMMFFGNDSWMFVANLIPSGDGSPGDATFLLGLRDRQLASAGGEPEVTGSSTTSETSHLDRFMPTELPDGLYPPDGIAIDFDSLGRLTADEITMPPSEWEFLERRVSTRARLWTQPGGYPLAVIVTEYPYEVLAGLALGTLEGSAYRPIESHSASSIRDLLAVDATPASEDAAPFVVEAFRRGRWEFRVVASGPDRAASERVASIVASEVAALAPDGGPTASVHPPGAVVSLAQAVAATAVVGAAALMLRRLLAGRARPAIALRPPTPLVTDVTERAVALRHDGRRLAAVQIAGCAVIVVGLVADIGWWWILVVAAGLTIGIAVTMRARRRELERTAHTWSVTSGWAVLLGLLSGALLVVGVALAVRALKESVLLPSLTHLRLSERVGLPPSRLGAALAVAGLGALVLGALLLRRARAHARSARMKTRADYRPPILYLRSFDDDGLSVPSVHSARRPFFELFGLRGRDPFEEGIAWELDAHGPVIAVGRPGRSVVSLGASRELLDPATWQHRVAERMDAAGWIVLAIGATDGLAWELDELTRRGHLAKSEFIVPPGTADEIERRWNVTSQAINHAAGRLLVAPVGIAGTFTVRVDPSSGDVTATRADRVDEAGYRAAIEVAFDARTASAPAGATATTLASSQPSGG